MEIRNLYTLLAIVNHKSFSDAGRSVGLSPSAVSLQVQALESEFGIALFDRSTRPPKLTEEGEALVKRVRDLVSIWDQLRSSPPLSIGGGRLDIGTVHSAISSFVPAALRKFRITQSGVGVRLHVALPHELETGIERGELDVAISLRPEAEFPYEWRKISTEKLCVIGSEDRLRKGSLRDVLETNTVIMLCRTNRATAVSKAIDEELARLSLSLDDRVEVNNYEYIRPLVEKDLGVAIVTMDERFMRSDDKIKWRRFGSVPIYRELGLLVKPGSLSDVRVKGLVECIESTVGTAEKLASAFHSEK